MSKSWVARFLGSTLGQKVLVGLTGVVLFGYLIAHVTGNLLFYLGASKINEYSAMLHSSPFLLWGVRGVLLVSVLVHIGLSISLARRNRRARPEKYNTKKNRKASFASRSMIITGPVIAIFVIYHILHMTTGTLHSDFVEGNVHGNLLVAFRQWPVAFIYIISLLLISMHLSHGIWSLFQTAGANNPKYDPIIRKVAVVATILIVGGFISVPIVITAGIFP